MVMTGNIRSWRHVIEMRASEHAEYEIRRVAYLIYKCMKEAEPILFSDYEEIESKDGVPIITTKYRKV
jgi:thymidylate synthase (FAD)